MTASSPGLIRDSMAAIIASVEPHVTTRFASGSASIPLKAFARRAIASRSSRAPQVIEYWLHPVRDPRILDREVVAGLAPGLRHGRLVVRNEGARKNLSGDT